MASSFLRFLDHTQRSITVGRIPLDEWSIRRRDLYLTTHNTHNRQTSMPPVRFEPTISASERSQTYALDRAATGTGKCGIISVFSRKKWGEKTWRSQEIPLPLPQPIIWSHVCICVTDVKAWASLLRCATEKTQKRIQSAKISLKWTGIYGSAYNSNLPCPRSYVVSDGKSIYWLDNLQIRLCWKFSAQEWGLLEQWNIKGSFFL